MASEPASATPDASGFNAEQFPFDSWKCGDPFKYPMPKVDGDPWAILLDPQLAKEKEQCEVWKDEVGNLLIFAGLFSAVVTAFIIESYKGLQPDPNETVVALLSRIATNLENSGNSSSSTAVILQQLTSQTPSPGISRVNILWFISLVLSLTVVLVGTVSLQWLREYLRYPADMSFKDRFAVFNMRREGLVTWHLPQVFLALPMLLQLSLILFLVGLIDFLLLIAPSNVYTPIITIIGLPILFLFLTTILPSCMWIFSPPVHARIFGRVPSQCPYKSPQAYVCQSILKPLVLAVTSKWRPWDWSDRGALRLREQSSILLYKQREKIRRDPGNIYSDLRTHGCSHRTSNGDACVHVIPIIYDLSAGLLASDIRTTDTPICHCIQEVIGMNDCLVNFDKNKDWTTDFDEVVTNGWNSYVSEPYMAINRGWYDYICSMFLLERRPIGLTPERMNIDDVICSREETIRLILTRGRVVHFASAETQRQASIWLCELFIRVANQYIRNHLRSLGLVIRSPWSYEDVLSPYGCPSLNGVDDAVKLDISRQYTKMLFQLFDAAASIPHTINQMDMDRATIELDNYTYIRSFIQWAYKVQTTADISISLQFFQSEVDKQIISMEQSLEVSQNCLLFLIMAEYVGGATLKNDYPTVPIEAELVSVHKTEAMALIPRLSKLRDGLQLSVGPDILLADARWRGYFRLRVYWDSNPNNANDSSNSISQLSLSGPPIVPNTILKDDQGENTESAVPMRCVPKEINNV